MYIDIHNNYVHVSCMYSGERKKGDLKVYYAIMTIVRSSNWLNDDDDGIGLVWPFALLLILLHVPCLYYLVSCFSKLCKSSPLSIRVNLFFDQCKSFLITLNILTSKIYVTCIKSIK